MAPQIPQWQAQQGIQAGAMGAAYDRAGALFGAALQSGQNMLDAKVKQESASVMESILSSDTTAGVDAQREAGKANVWADQSILGAAGIEQKDKILGKEAAAEQSAYTRGVDQRDFEYTANKDKTTSEYKAAKDKADLDFKYYDAQQKNARLRAKAAMDGANKAIANQEKQWTGLVDNYMSQSAPVTTNMPVIKQTASAIHELAKGARYVTNENGESVIDDSAPMTQGPMTLATITAATENWKQMTVVEQYPKRLTQMAKDLGTTVDQIPTAARNQVMLKLNEEVATLGNLAIEENMINTVEGVQEYTLNKNALAGRFDASSKFFFENNDRKANNKIINMWEGQFPLSDVSNIIKAIPADTPPEKLGETYIRATLELKKNKWSATQGPAFNAYYKTLSSELASGKSSPKDAANAIAKAEKEFNKAVYTNEIAKLAKDRNKSPAEILSNTILSKRVYRKVVDELGVDPKDFEKRSNEAKTRLEKQTKTGNALLNM